MAFSKAKQLHRNSTILVVSALFIVKKRMCKWSSSSLNTCRGFNWNIVFFQFALRNSIRYAATGHEYLATRPWVLWISSCVVDASLVALKEVYISTPHGEFYSLALGLLDNFLAERASFSGSEYPPIMEAASSKLSEPSYIKLPWIQTELDLYNIRKCKFSELTARKHVLHLRHFTQENWAWFEFPGTSNAKSLRGLESFPWVLFLWWAESDSETRVDNGRYLPTDGYAHH